MVLRGKGACKMFLRAKAVQLRGRFKGAVVFRDVPDYLRQPPFSGIFRRRQSDCIAEQTEKVVRGISANRRETVQREKRRLREVIFHVRDQCENGFDIFFFHDVTSSRIFYSIPYFDAVWLIFLAIFCPYSTKNTHDPGERQNLRENRTNPHDNLAGYTCNLPKDMLYCRKINRFERRDL